VESSNIAQLKIATDYHTNFDFDDQYVERFVYDWSLQNPLSYEADVPVVGMNTAKVQLVLGE